MGANSLKRNYLNDFAQNIGRTGLNGFEARFGGRLFLWGRLFAGVMALILACKK